MRSPIPQRVPINDTGRVYAAHAEALSAKLQATAQSGWWLNGPNVRAFADDFRAYLGVPHVIPVASGTDALELAMRAIIQVRHPNGRELVTVANAGGYTVTACRHVGLIPVFADIDETSQLADPQSVLEALGPDTAMVVATHLYGGIVDVPALRRSMDAAGYAAVAIIEDCAQAHGGSLGGQYAGSMSEIAAFSFYPTKNLGAMGDAGAVVTSDDELCAVVRRLQQYGWSDKYCVSIPGGRNSRMDELQAAVLSVLLPHLDALNRRRIDILAAYRETAKGDVRFPSSATGTVAHLAIAMSPRRDDFRRHMSERNIATEIHYPVLDCDQPAWAKLPQRMGPLGLGRSKRSVDQIVTLPCFPFMTDDEIGRVLDALNAWSRT